MNSLQPLLRAFEEVLGKEEVERICRSCRSHSRDEEVREDTIHRTIVEAAILRDARDDEDQWDERTIDWTDPSDDGRSIFDSIYSTTLSESELNHLWDECESISRTTSLSSESTLGMNEDTFTC